MIVLTVYYWEFFIIRQLKKTKENNQILKWLTIIKIKYYNKMLQICSKIVEVFKVEDMTEVEEVFVVEDIIIEVINPKFKRIRIIKL